VLLGIVLAPYSANFCIDPLVPCESTSALDDTEGVVLITGASTGIGRQTALVYAKRGARLLLTARREADLVSLQRECLLLGASQTTVVAVDVSSTEAILAPLLKSKRSLSVLLLNHAYIPLQLASEAAAEGGGGGGSSNLTTFKAVINTNFVASVQLLHAVLKDGSLLARDARIGIVGSMGTAFYPGFLSAYVSSKAALISFAEVYRVELELAGRSATTVSIMYLGEIGTDHHLKEGGGDPANPLMITPQECARGIVRGLDRRLTDAYIPWFMGPLGLLGKIVPLRAMLFETGFLKGKSGLIARIAESATASATAAAKQQQEYGYTHTDDPSDYTPNSE